MATTSAVFPARLMTRNLLQLKNNAIRLRGASWTDHVSISQAASDDLRWWIHHLKEWNGTSWVQSPTELEVFTDASDSGW
ncbi:hypothetical protein BGZ46_006656, partial [Entomortierella lignicola]